MKQIAFFSMMFVMTLALAGCSDSAKQAENTPTPAQVQQIRAQAERQTQQAQALVKRANALESETQAKVAKVKADQRALSAALENYMLDNGPKNSSRATTKTQGPAPMKGPAQETSATAQKKAVPDAQLNATYDPTNGVTGFFRIKQ